MAKWIGAAAAVALAVSGCGDDTTLNNGGTATISGGVSGSVTVTAVGATTSGGGVGFAITTASGVTPGINAAISINTSSLQTGTYANGTASVTQAGVTLQKSGTIPQTWAAFYKESGSADQGSFSLNLTSTGSSITGSGGTAWPNPHGTLTATLKPITATGASGDVTLSVTF